MVNTIPERFQTFTSHFYHIACNGDSASGNFTTQNIPLGNTYDEPYPVDLANPGQYAWPTLNLNDPTQSIIDPKTGLLIRPFILNPNAPVAYPPAGGAGYCAQGTVTTPQNEQGVFCDNNEFLTFVNSVTGQIHPLGALGFTSGLAVPVFGITDPSLIYSIAYYQGVVQLASLKYQGNYADFTGALPLCDFSAQPCLQVTPLSSGHKSLAALFAEIDPTMNADYCYNFAYLENAQGNGQHLISCNRNGKDSYGWIFVYDETQDKMVAMTTSFKQEGAAGQPNPPARWGALHSPGYTENGWIDITSDLLLGNGNYTGYGPYVSNIVSGLLDSVPQVCPPDAPFGTAGTAQCTTVTVDSEPFDPTPQTDNGPPGGGIFCPSPGGTDPVSLLTTDVGDYFWVDPANYEYVRLLKKSGANNLTWTIQRGVPAYGSANWVKNHPGVTILYASPSAPAIGGGSLGLAAFHWHYTTDPWGTNADGQSWITETWPASHNNMGFGYFINGMYVVTAAASGPLLWSGQGSNYQVNSLAAFAGLGISGNVVKDTHPGSPVVDPNGNGVWILDGRPMEKGPNASDGQTHAADALGGNLYHFTSNAYGGYAQSPFTGVQWDPKHGPVYAFCGDHVLADASGPASQLTGNASDSYKYCVAKNANECEAGSKTGDLYVKCPGVTQAYCTAVDNPALMDLCFGQNGGSLGAIPQTDISKPDSVGANGRNLTYGFSHYFHWDPFWNAQPVGNSPWFMFDVPAPNGTALTQVYMGKLPPFPAQDGVDRHDFLPIPISVTPPSGLSVDNAVVQFGYSENGSPSNFFCTPRNEACIKGAQAGNEFDYASDKIAGVPCPSSGCGSRCPRSRSAWSIFRFSTGTPEETLSAKIPPELMPPSHPTRSPTLGPSPERCPSPGSMWVHRFPSTARFR